MRKNLGPYLDTIECFFSSPIHLTRYNTVDQADAKDAMEKLDSLFNEEEQPSAAIVLQAQKKGARRNLPTP